jgi:hypothetical protein
MKMIVPDDLVRGAVDFHVHAAPDGFRPRALHFMEAVEQAHTAGYAALAIKNHEYCTAPLALYAESKISNIRVLGGVVLNQAVGGFNPEAVEAAARQGAKIVWLPTFSAKNDPAKTPMKKGLTVFNDGGGLIPSLRGILEFIRDKKMILATGHLNYQEISAVVDEAGKIGLKRVLVNHPFRPESPCLSLEEQKSLASRGAILEHCAFHFLRNNHPLPMEQVVRAIREVGSQYCLLCSDMGQADHPVPVEGLKRFVAALLAAGIQPEEITVMTKENPRRFLED